MGGPSDLLPNASSFGVAVTGDLEPTTGLQNGAGGAGRHRSSATAGSRRESGRGASAEQSAAGGASIVRESDDFLVTRGDLDTRLSFELSRGRGVDGNAALPQAQAAGGATFNILPHAPATSAGTGAGISSVSGTLSIGQPASFGPNAVTLYAFR